MTKIITLLFILVSVPFYAQWWVPQNSGVTANLNDVYGISGNSVVIVGNGGVILKTTDGGTHWNIKASGTIENLTKVQFVNATIGYVVGTGGTILKTIDGGENWNSIATGTTTNLYGLSCVNESIFYISGDNGLIRKTSDGGVNFVTRDYGTTYPFRTIQFLNDQVGYASSYEYYGHNSYAFIKTIDGGTTWALVSNQISTFYFLNENTGFVTSGSVFKTIDGGLNLIDMVGSMAPAADLFSSNENEVWTVENSFTLCGCSNFCIKKDAITNTGTIQETQNCYADTSGNPPFEAITFADATNGYVVGDFGLIYKNTTGNMENLGINEFDNANDIMIYPNPSSNSIIVENNNTTLRSIEISDMNGRKILATTMVNSPIDISSLAKGVYLVGFTFDDGSIAKKLIKQ